MSTLARENCEPERSQSGSWSLEECPAAELMVDGQLGKNPTEAQAPAGSCFTAFTLLWESGVQKVWTPSAKSECDGLRKGAICTMG